MPICVFSWNCYGMILFLWLLFNISFPLKYQLSKWWTFLHNVTKIGDNKINYCPDRLCLLSYLPHHQMCIIIPAPPRVMHPRSLLWLQSPTQTKPLLSQIIIFIYQKFVPFATDYHVVTDRMLCPIQLCWL